jgi:hypothetical protein
MSYEKKGLELIVDRVEAVRVRLDHFAGVSGYDVGALDHWIALCKEALAEAKRWQPAIERITALLALPVDADPQTITNAVNDAVRRLEQLELEMVKLRETRL